MTGVSTSCGACKFLRRKCASDCVFAPYFSYNEAVAHFGAVHKVFGASNVSRLLLQLPEQFRSEAALTISFEALSRMKDPVHGCVSYIYALQREVANLQGEIEVLGNHMANNMSNGVTIESSIGSQETHHNHMIDDQFNNYNNNNFSPLLSSQEYQIINNNNQHQQIWSSRINNYQEETTVSSLHAENGSCSSENYMTMNNIEHNLFDITGTGNGVNDEYIIGLLNAQSFDDSSLFGSLPYATP